MPESLSFKLEQLFFIVPITFTALFHVVNPIGSGILFLNLTPLADNKTRRTLARKIAVTSLIIMLVTLLTGVYILKLFGITIPIVQICGGFLILTMGWRSLGDDKTDESERKRFVKPQTDQESYLSKVFFPYTFPFTVGPGTIAVTLTVSAQFITRNYGNGGIAQYLGAIIAVLLVSVSIYVCYRSAYYLMSKISTQIRAVIMKILSFILLCIGGQIMANGLTEFLQMLHKSGI